jgi:hypothetical protein
MDFVFGTSFHEHMDRLRAVLERIQLSKLKLKPEKCELFQSEVRFLGHVITKEGILPNPDNTAKVLDWPEPKTVTQVRQFLGFSSYYRRFVKNFATIAKPLHDLTKKEATLQWTPTCQQAFDKLKTILTGPEVMAYPKEQGEFILDTDACDVGIGAVLSQLQEGKERVVAYASRSLNKAEKNYCVTDKELLAVRYFMEYFKQYLLGKAFLVRSDHQALHWLFSFKEPTGRVARWIEVMSAYDFSIEYRPGKRHGNADGMSRCLDPRIRQCQINFNSVALKCGPCRKCLKKSELMQATTPDVEKIRQTRPAGIIQQESQSQNVIHWILYLLAYVWLIGDSLLGRVISSRHNESLRQEVKMDMVIKKTHNIRVPNNRCIQMGKSIRPWISKLRKVSPTTTNWAWSQAYSNSELRKLQLDDDDVGVVLRWKETGYRPQGPVVCSASPEVRHYWNHWTSLEVTNGLLYKHYYRGDGSDEYFQLIVPQKLRKEVFYHMHKGPLSGHLGKKKTIQKTLQSFYWYELRQDIKLMTKRCDTCAANKKPVRSPRAKLGDMRTGSPWDRLAMDVLGPLPITSRNNRYILVVADTFSKWTEIFAMPDQTAHTCANLLLNEVIGRFGCSYDLHTDQGRAFESDLIRDLCTLLGIRKTRTSSKHPQGNGQVERFNITLIKMIRAY